MRQPSTFRSLTPLLIASDVSSPPKIGDHSRAWSASSGSPRAWSVRSHHRAQDEAGLPKRRSSSRASERPPVCHPSRLPPARLPQVQHADYHPGPDCSGSRSHHPQAPSAPPPRARRTLTTLRMPRRRPHTHQMAVTLQLEECGGTPSRTTPPKTAAPLRREGRWRIMQQICIPPPRSGTHPVYRLCGAMLSAHTSVALFRRCPFGRGATTQGRARGSRGTT